MINEHSIQSYTYKGIHKSTGQIYYGARCAFTGNPDDDFGKKYFTSSRKVKLLGFENFNWEIVLYGFDKKIGFELETELIGEIFKTDKCLNGYCSNKNFNNAGKTKETDEGVAKTAKKLSGRTKETDEGVALKAIKISKSLKGRTKEEFEYLQHHALMMTGRTKENDIGTAISASKRRGRTKETDEGVARGAEKQRGRSKETHSGIASGAIKRSKTMTGRTKETCHWLKQHAENLSKLSPIEVLELIKKRNAGLSWKIIHEWVIGELKIDMAISSVGNLYRREIKRNTELLNII